MGPKSVQGPTAKRLKPPTDPFQDCWAGSSNRYLCCSGRCSIRRHCSLGVANLCACSFVARTGRSSRILTLYIRADARMLVRNERGKPKRGGIQFNRERKGKGRNREGDGHGWAAPFTSLKLDRPD
jgi:hypothetical protein